MQKVEQKNQGNLNCSARFALPAHSNSHCGLLALTYSPFFRRLSLLQLIVSMLLSVDTAGAVFCLQY
jgi:hypothetical protein